MSRAASLFLMRTLRLTFPGLDFPVVEDSGAWAAFTPDYQHRLALARVVSGQLVVEIPLIWCMLNPSKAGAEESDATIRRLVGFTKRAGRSWFVVVNLRSGVSTVPSPDVPDHVLNMGMIRRVLLELPSSPIVLAWGNHAKWFPHEAEKVERATIGRDVYCLGRTKDGEPRHPVRLPYSQGLVPL